MAKRQINDTFSLNIHSLSSRGEGIGSDGGLALFVDGALPGEEVVAKLHTLKKNYGIAELLEIKRPSPSRRAPACSLFGRCGGCQVMQLDYQAQLVLKQKRVADALSRIGHFSSPPVHPCRPSPMPFHYRNKIQLAAVQTNEGLEMGFFAKRSHRIIPVENCPIHCSMGEEVYRLSSRLIKSSSLTPYCETSSKGCLRHLLIRSAVHSKESLIAFVTTGSQREEAHALANRLYKECKGVVGVVENINRRSDSVILGKEWRLLAGRNHLRESMMEMEWKISAAAFFQVNPFQAPALYQQVLDYAEVTPKARILDAYCGVGTLSLLAARSAAEVVGIEAVPQAILDARENARLNQISNCQFIAKPVEDAIKGVGRFDIVLLNPPRKGCEKSVISALIKQRAKRIVYLSCDPATLARDLALLAREGYRLDEATPFDLFPQTMHVETVARLTLH